jgi:hypothetical protein
MSQTGGEPAARYELREAVLHTGARIHRWEEKAGFGHLFEYESVATPAVEDGWCIDPSTVIDLTSRMTPDGTLPWDVPDGHWVVVRLGYSLTGAKNRPAGEAGLGYEVDKLNRTHVEAYYRAYTDPFAAALGPLWGTRLKYLLLDSWEAGGQNWTEDILAEFRVRRGYDPWPFLPALTGRVVGSAATADRFLWDFRRTLADLVADHFYGALDAAADRDGLSTYAEASGVSLEFPEDSLLNKSKVDIPMGEFWVRDPHPRLMYYQDVRGAASAAHAYGKPIVAAEAFTGGGYESPFTLKKTADYWFTQGVNRLVFHTSAHQPLNRVPGNTMVGTHLHRHITWAEQAGPFLAYLSRTSHLLQQGRFVADLAYLLPEGAPSTMPIWGAELTPPPPDGYDFDYINADVLLHRLSVDENGRLTLPDGMQYRILVLPDSTHMRPELLRKIRTLATGGATVTGPRPEASPSLMGSPEADADVRALAADLWGDLDGRSRVFRRCGRGAVAWGLPMHDILSRMDVPPDMTYAGGLDADITWIHRRTPDADIYFLANPSDAAHTITARFRVADREAECWHPDSGRIEPASYHSEGPLTVVPLSLDPGASVFVVFRRPAAEPSRVVAIPGSREAATLEGPWTVEFPANSGAPEQITVPSPIFWTEHPNPGVRFFSGTATYTHAFNWPDTPATTTAHSVWLDLGRVRVLANVELNDHPLGILWKPPYRIDITHALQTGQNHLRIRITNQWTNRLLGDRTLPPQQRVLDAGGATPGAFGSPPQDPPPSGLLGPVQLLTQ